MAENKNPSSKPSGWFEKIFYDKSGSLNVGEKPNMLLIIAIVTGLLSVVLRAGLWRITAVVIAFGCFFAWAWGELTEGESYFRRIVGAIALIGLTVAAAAGLNALANATK